jgi:hypothetical protein
LAGLTSSPDQSSEQEVLDWKDIFEDVTDVFNRSPMGKKASVYSCLLDIISKWFGSNTDHCSKEKKVAWLKTDAKQDALHEKMGEEICQAYNVGLEDVCQVHVFSESTNALRLTMDVSHHSGQYLSLSICKVLVPWL